MITQENFAGILHHTLHIAMATRWYGCDVEKDYRDNCLLREDLWAFMSRRRAEGYCFKDGKWGKHE